jgi:hypothetical protein
VGGLPIPSTIIPKASRQSCAVEIASTGSSSSIHHTAKTTRQLAGDATEPKPKAYNKPILGCCIRTRLLCIMHAYLHARSDHSNPKHPHHHPTAATLDPPNALCLESDKSSQPKRLFYVKRSNRILHMQKDLHHKYAAIESQMITPPNIDSSL